MTFTESIVTCIKNCVNYSGRASRSEYWFWLLFVLLGTFAAHMIDAALFRISGNRLYSLYPIGLAFRLLTLLPSTAVSFRRLHDVNRSGWWWLISFTLIGIIPLLYWTCQKGTEGENRFGNASS